MVQHDYRPITDLVTCARNGEKQAWGWDRRTLRPLIWSICRQYRLGDADAEDVGQMVWLHLVDHLDDLLDPAACQAGWPPRHGGRASESGRPPPRCRGLPGRLWTWTLWRTPQQYWPTTSWSWPSATPRSAPG